MILPSPSPFHYINEIIPTSDVKLVGTSGNRRHGACPYKNWRGVFVKVPSQHLLGGSERERERELELCSFTFFISGYQASPLSYIFFASARSKNLGLYGRRWRISTDHLPNAKPTLFRTSEIVTGMKLIYSFFHLEFFLTIETFQFDFF